MENVQGVPFSKRHKVFVTIMTLFVTVTTVFISLAVVSVGSTFGADVFLKLFTAMVGMVFAAILLISCCFIIREKSWQGHSFITVVFLLYINIILSGVIDWLGGLANYGNLLFVLATVFSVITVLIQLLFWFYESESLPENRYKRYFSVWFCIMSLAYLAALIVNSFSNTIFFYDEYGNLIYNGYLFDFVFFMLAYSSYLVYILPQKCRLRKKISLASVAVLPLFYIFLIIVNSRFGIVYYEGYSGIVIALILAAYAIFFGDYMESHNLMLHQKAEIAEQSRKQTELQTSIMLSQIKPHFLYNAITAIRNICKTDQLEAYTSLGLFADYLRANMDALENGRMINFDKELEHIKTYLMLEQMRFGDELQVEYDIRYRDFTLPALTVQPIVENAVRHGATMNENGGKIIVSSEKTDDGAIITVKDDGPGFDPDTMQTDDRKHFGLANVRNCLKIKGCGELHIDSKRGTGTTVTIHICGEVEK